jgi:crossover junction endodeoxyribonuclease RuvC
MLTRPLRIVALDLSLTGTGIAVTHDSVQQPRLACRTVSPLKRDRRPTIIDHERLHEVFGAVATAVQMKPDLVVIEWLPLIAGKGDVSLRIAELHGAIKHWLWSQRIPYADVRPQELKTYATGNANAGKALVLQRMRERYGKKLHIHTEDEADATALLALALDAYGQPLAEVPDGCRVAVGKVRWPELAVAP